MATTAQALDTMTFIRDSMSNLFNDQQAMFVALRRAAVLGVLPITQEHMTGEFMGQDPAVWNAAIEAAQRKLTSIDDADSLAMAAIIK